jgi:uncharacterized protein
MKSIFVDTSYYLALLNPDDHYHAQAVDLGRVLRLPIIVTEFVLLELGNSLANAVDRLLFIGIPSSLQHDPNAIVIPASHELFQHGCDLFAKRPDKNWSLVDCTSFVVMEEYGITDALTADHHFAQAGFTVLLK